MTNLRALSTLLLLLALGSVSGCSSDKGFSSQRIHRADYGAAWPLAVDEAVLACEPGGVLTLTVDGRSEKIAQVDLDLPKDERVAKYMTVQVVGGSPSHDYSVFIPRAMDICD